jgi:hypothetical protein
MYKICVGSVDVVDVISLSDVGKDDNVLEQDYTYWEDAYIDAMKIKSALIDSVFSLSTDVAYNDF